MDSLQPSALPELIQLARQIDFAQDEFTLYLVEVNSPVQRDRLIMELEKLLAQKGITTVEVICDKPARDLLTHIRHALNVLEPEPPACILVKGLEHSIKQDDLNSPLLAHLNLARELYRVQVSYPLVLWLPEYALTTLAHIAPDFWAWRSGVFEFEPTELMSSVGQRSLDPEMRKQVERDIISGSATLAVESKMIAVGDAIRDVVGDIHYVDQAAPFTSTQPTAPPPPAHFLDRQAELKALSHALTRNDSPQAIVALQGMGGIGKTALTTQLAAQLADTFPGGVLWANLSAHRGNPLPILATWARLGGHDVSNLPDQQARAEVVRGILARYVAEQGRLLVVLDDVRPEWLDGARLLQSARPPDVPLLLTTRQVRVAQTLRAKIIRLDILSLEEARTLLVKLTDNILTGDDADQVAELCGYLPLALELAASVAVQEGASRLLTRLRNAATRLDALTLDDARRRDESVRLAFSLSYDTLDPEERRLFRTLSVFAPAPFVTEHVAAVVDQQAAVVEARLDRLVGLALVSWEKGDTEQARYLMHPLLRDYAAALLKEAGEAFAARAAYIDHYTAYAEAHSRPTAADCDALEAELPNLLAAMDRAYQEGQWMQVRRLAWALCDPATGVLAVRGQLSELRARLEQAILAARAEGHQRDVAAFSANLAALLMDAGDLELAGQEYQRVLTIFEELDERESVAVVYHQLGRLAQTRGEYAEAQRLYQQSLAIAEELGNRADVARTLHQLGILAQTTGGYAEAQHLYQRSLEINEVLGNQADIAVSLHQLGRLAQDAGDYKEALRRYQQGLNIAVQMGDRAGLAQTWHQLGILAQTTGQLIEAQHLYRQSLAISEELGDRMGVARTLHQLGLLAQTAGEYAEARHLYQQSLAINGELSNRVDIAATLGQLANLAKDEGNLAEAEQFYHRNLVIVQELGDSFTESLTLFNLAHLYEKQGGQEEALSLLEQAVSIAEQAGLPILEKYRNALEQIQGKIDVKFKSETSI